ncbi:hypothetical protein AMJ52_06125 [candidate division TA06 bacterium DG_78]|uniref:GTP-binding protein n=1 Tax=candidate division TA06 bacterium DG_78 TaxID=1703772 RepID=A0A0S7YDN2_UNCT6|nr:MAG: hypothetical protein AMJ52_06125 [candidate division TA06 bacterium DG_78]
MAKIKTPEKVLPITGLIYVEEFSVDEALKKFADDVGGILLKSGKIPFTHTTYYNKEMGGTLLRQWVAFEKLIDPDFLAHLKIKSNRVENEYLHKNGGRQINVDPGLISMSNVILASTKNYSHRIYLGKGIYGEVTLIYKGHQFNPLEWTYPDYREKIALDFFTEAREMLKERLAPLEI